ncbi:fructose-bisphosphatase [Ranunculus cassubicifolius]
MQSSTLFITSTLNLPPTPLHFPPLTLPHFTQSLQFHPLMASSTIIRTQSKSYSSNSDTGFQTLLDYVGKEGEDVGDDLVVLISHLQYACKRIAAVVASPFNSVLGKQGGGGGGLVGGDRDDPKPLDIVSVIFVLRLNF